MEITTNAVLLDAQASVVDLVVRELNRARNSRHFADEATSPSRVLYEDTKIHLLEQLRQKLVEILGPDTIALVEVSGSDPIGKVIDTVELRERFARSGETRKRAVDEVAAELGDH